jgi:hypothetical protein
LISSLSFGIFTLYFHIDHQLPNEVIEFIKTQLEWMMDQIKTHTNNLEFSTDGKIYYQDTAQLIGKEIEFWLSVECTLLWVRGMWDGLRVSASTLSFYQFIALPYMADLEDIMNKFKVQNGELIKVTIKL